MSARDVIDEHLWTATADPELARSLLDGYRSEIRAEVLAEAAAMAEARAGKLVQAANRLAIIRGVHDARYHSAECWRAAAEELRQMAAMATEDGKDTGTSGESTQSAELTAYRAAYVDGTQLGLYASRDAARAHCAALIEQEEPYATSAEWCSEEDDGPESLVIVVGGREIETGYLVTPVTEASKYDPEAGR